RADFARLRFPRITHEEIEELFAFRKIVAGDCIGMPGVKIVVCARRNDWLGLEGPRTCKFVGPRALDLFVPVFEADDEEPIVAVTVGGLIGMIRVHDEERLVESAHRLWVGHWERTFQFPMSGPEIIAICTDGLCVPRWIVKEHHPPARDSLIPNDTGIA